MTRPTVLVPIEVLEGESLPEGTPELLAEAHVILLGYHVIPDQTAPGQARMQFEERAQDRLTEYRTVLEEGGATVETRLVFTHDGQQTIDRQSKEHDCLATLVPRTVTELEDVLVAVRGTVGIDRLAQVVTGLFAETDVTITLFHVTDEDESDADVDLMLDGLVDRFEDGAIDPARIGTRTERGVKPADAIADLAAEYDVVVMGESDPSLATFVFGHSAEQVAERFLGPVLVVEREQMDESTD
ncbi:universal stress protein [Halococcoides cellulosivorans]|uniref:Universal stress protein n=1 Tax=Halococcoides cellulosivorans TaxID=1679096 RepID=A0A2R4X1N0_9EURY|nr:universal stress protein [Halococcoides cellulosivorans]AWB27685.1 universal stress protein [Halococcoides cellulosivorans]